MTQGDVRPLTRAQMAWRAARDLSDGMVVNLGIGIPVLAADHVPAGRSVILQSENGVIGMGPAASAEAADPDLVDASSRRVTLRPGGTVIDSAAAFAMIRGGHIDVTILGAFEVSAGGDLANWEVRPAGSPPGGRGALVGGAMDLAACARSVWAVMEHMTREGRPRLLSASTLPLTARACVRRVFTDLAVIEIDAGGFLVREMVPGMTRTELSARTGAALRFVDGAEGALTVPSLA